MYEFITQWSLWDWFEIILTLFGGILAYLFESAFL